MFTKNENRIVSAISIFPLLALEIFSIIISIIEKTNVSTVLMHVVYMIAYIFVSFTLFMRKDKKNDRLLAGLMIILAFSNLANIVTKMVVLKNSNSDILPEYFAMSYAYTVAMIVSIATLVNQFHLFKSKIGHILIPVFLTAIGITFYLTFIKITLKSFAICMFPFVGFISYAITFIFSLMDELEVDDTCKSDDK